MTLAGFTLDQFEAARKSRFINGTLPPSLAFPPQLVESEPLHPGFRTSYEPEANPQLVVSIGLHTSWNQRQSRQRLRRCGPPAGIVHRKVSLTGLHSTGATTFCGYAQTPPSRFQRQQESAIFLSRGKRSTPRAGRELRSRGVRLRTSRRNSPRRCCSMGIAAPAFRWSSPARWPAPAVLSPRVAREPAGRGGWR